MTAEIESDIARLTGMFGSSHEQNGALGSQLDQQSRKTMNMPPQDQSFQRMKMQFISDFDFKLVACFQSNKMYTHLGSTCIVS